MAAARLEDLLRCVREIRSVPEGDTITSSPVKDDPFGKNRVNQSVMKTFNFNGRAMPVGFNDAGDVGTGGIGGAGVGDPLYFTAIWNLLPAGTVLIGNILQGVNIRLIRIIIKSANPEAVTFGFTVDVI